MKATDVRNAMNAAGAAGTPFLFGFDFLRQEGFFCQDAQKQRRIQFSFPNGTSLPLVDGPRPAPTLRAQPLPEADYAQGFSCARAALMRGDSFLLNYTARSRIDLTGDLESIYAHSRARYKILMPGEWVCFSPEPFVRIACGGQIASYPMKGTIDSRKPNALQLLMQDPKETAEHYTIVDLIRNDLNRVATGVHVKAFRFAEEVEGLKNSIIQTSSTIEGQLAPNWEERLGDIFWELLPAGSISGAPKETTVRTILLAENAPRGYYTGVAGYYNGQTVDSTVLIRFVEKIGEQHYFHSGGGITIQSQCHEEYEEMVRKIYLPVEE